MSPKLSLIVPCYNEEATIAACLERVRAALGGKDGLELEIIVVDDASRDNSFAILERIVSADPAVKLVRHERNRGKGAALRTGLMLATGDFVGIQDADLEYDPEQYLLMLEAMLDGRADVVYGSRYLRPDTRRVLYFWHTWMNKSLTFVSNMFTNLDITDMETCYKLFRREVIQAIAPTLKEDRFGFEPEVTARVAKSGRNVYECAISYHPRSYEEGKKLGWKDGLRALYCILHYGADTAPLPMQVLIYLFIGFTALVVNQAGFFALLASGVPLHPAIVAAYALSALSNYVLCIVILFRHKARWNTGGEILLYVLSVMVMCGADYALTTGLIALSWGSGQAKFWSSIAGFIGNFLLRRFLVFPSKKAA